MGKQERTELQTEYLRCRTLGHAWFEGTASDLGKPSKGLWWFVVACRCGTQRRDLVLVESGEVFSRKYEYPEDYRLVEKTARTEFRMEWARRRVLKERKLKRAVK